MISGQMSRFTVLGGFMVFKYYSFTHASAGHTAAHASQSMQAAASITYTSPAEMQETGHSLSHTPQAMQASVIL